MVSSQTSVCPTNEIAKVNKVVRPHVSILLYPTQTLFVGDILFSCCPSVRPSVRNALFP